MSAKARTSEARNPRGRQKAARRSTSTTPAAHAMNATIVYVRYTVAMTSQSASAPARNTLSGAGTRAETAVTPTAANEMAMRPSSATGYHGTAGRSAYSHEMGALNPTSE